MPLRPATIIKSLHRPLRYDGCIPTHSGGSFCLLDPKPEHIVIEDIVQGLSYKYRFGGQIGPITVAEHCVLVEQIVSILWPGKPKARLPALLHDACEAYTHDIQAPVRKFVKVSLPNGDLVSWGDLERMINLAISKALWDGMDFYSMPEVQAADALALAIEKSYLPTIRDEVWGIPEVPPELAHLQVNFYPPVTAGALFRARFLELQAP